MRAVITASPRAGLRQPKKATDQRAFKARWIRKRARVLFWALLFSGAGLAVQAR